MPRHMELEKLAWLRSDDTDGWVRELNCFAKDATGAMKASRGSYPKGASSFANTIS